MAAAPLLKVAEARESFLRSLESWINVDSQRVDDVLVLCNCLPVIEEQGRNPFTSVQGGTSFVDESHSWMFLGRKKNWQIGDNKEFPSSVLRIREVNKKMADYIINHFKKMPTVVPSALSLPSTVQQSKSASLAAPPAFLTSSSSTIAVTISSSTSSLSSGPASGSLAILAPSTSTTAIPTSSSMSSISSGSTGGNDAIIDPQHAKIPAHYLASIKDKAEIKSLTTAPPIHVAGTPGTGKSAFALYLLHRLLMMYPDDAFVYRHGDVNPGCFIYYRDKSYYHHSIAQAFNDSLWLKLLTKHFTRPIWTVLDGAAVIPTGTPEANLIVLTSPGQQSVSLKHFLKYATTIVNPPWTLVDIEAVRKSAYPYLRADIVREEYKKWGGIPRILLDWANKPEKIRVLNASICTADPEKLFRQVGLPKVDHANVNGVHFHLVPGQDVPDDVPDYEETGFQYALYCWASTWMQERFWDELKNSAGELRIMNFLLDRNNIAAARAYAFEPHVFRTLENAGIVGRLKRLSDGIMLESQKIGPLVRGTFSNFAEIPTDPNVFDGQFYVPVQTNHTSVDLYILQAGILVQITVGQKHGIKWSGLKAAIDSGLFKSWKADHPQEKLRLVFLCDKYNFEQFGKQNYLNSEGKTYKRQADIANIEKHFEQYAWELDVEEQLKQHQTSLRKAVKPKKSSFGTFGTGNELKQTATKPKGKGKGKDTADPSSDVTMASSSYIGSSIIQSSRKRSAGQADLDDPEGS